MMKTKVLIIEPNEVLADMWCAYLKQHSIDAFVFIPEITKAGDLREWGRPNVILSGIEPLEGHFVSAEDFCLQLYGKEDEVKPPLVQLYASYLGESQIKSLKKSVFILLKKPVSFVLLLDAVRKASFESLFAYYRNNHSAAMTAELKGDALVGILQYIDATKKSGMILIKAPGKSAFISFNKGLVVNAQYAGFSGANAIYEVLTWQSGQASFFESEIDVESAGLIPEINALIQEGHRQAEEIRQAENTFDDPGIYISRNDEIAVDPSTLSGRIYANLAEEKTLGELKLMLSGLTHRQVMTTINGMLLRDEIQYQNRAQNDLAASVEMCKSIVDSIKGKRAAQLVHHPVNIGIYCVTPQLSKKFIGALCNKNIAGKVVISAGKQCVVVSELSQNGDNIDFFDIAASVLIFDKSNTEQLEESLEFIKKVKKSNSPSYIIAEVPDDCGGNSQSAHLLGIKDGNNIIFDFKWTQKSTLTIIEKIFETIINPVY
jgi:hypothetical protein